MRSVLNACTVLCDTLVDGVRLLFGLPPLQPTLEKLAFDTPLTVRQASKLRIETRRTYSALLRIAQDNQLLFDGSAPRSGQLSITPLTPGVITVQLELSRHFGGAHNTVDIETVFEPRPAGPAIERFTAPRRITFGDRIAVAWDAPDAEHVRIAQIEDANTHEDLYEPVGQVLLRPTRPGRVTLRILAQTPWGETIRTRTVKVVPPRPRLELLRPAKQSGLPGKELTYEWRSTAALSVWLITPERVEPQQVADNGFLQVKLGSEPSQFVLIARGYRGIEHRAALHAIPSPFADLETAP